MKVGVKVTARVTARVGGKGESEGEKEWAGVATAAGATYIGSQLGDVVIGGLLCVGGAVADGCRNQLYGNLAGEPLNGGIQNIIV